MDTVNKQITDIKITDIKLKKDGSAYLLDVELDCENNKAYIVYIFTIQIILQLEK